MPPPFPLLTVLNQRFRFHAPLSNILLQIRSIRFVSHPPAPNLPRQTLQEPKHVTLRHQINIILSFTTFPPPNPATPIAHAPMPPRLRRIVCIQQPIQLIIAPLALILLPVVIEIERKVLPPAPPSAVLRLALALLAEVVAKGETGLAGSFKAGTQRGDAGGDVVFGEVEEGGLGSEICRFNVLGDLVEGLADSGVGGAHGVDVEGLLLHRYVGGGYATVFQGSMNIFRPSVLILDSCQADTKPAPSPRVAIRQPYHFDPGQPHHQPETRFKPREKEGQCYENELLQGTRGSCLREHWQDMRDLEYLDSVFVVSRTDSTSRVRKPSCAPL